MTAPIDIDCPTCKVTSGRYCVVDVGQFGMQCLTFYHAARVDAAARTSVANPKSLALYVVRWLRDRNGGREFAHPIASMSVEAFELLLEELELILKHGGRPPNWIAP